MPRGFTTPLSCFVLRGGGGVGGGPLWLIVRFDVSGRAGNESVILAVAVALALDRETNSCMDGSPALILLPASSTALGLGKSGICSPLSREILGRLALWGGSFCWRERPDLEDELGVRVWDSKSLTKVLVAGMGVSSVY